MKMQLQLQCNTILVFGLRGFWRATDPAFVSNFNKIFQSAAASKLVPITSNMFKALLFTCSIFTNFKYRKL